MESLKLVIVTSYPSLVNNISRNKTSRSAEDSEREEDNEVTINK